jgi:hypothetical protein
MGAGKVGGGGTTARCVRRFPGTMFLTVASARCSSACAFFAFCSLGLAGIFGAFGLMSAVRGRPFSCRKLKLGSTGFANTLIMKTTATPVTTTARKR